jgi:hypothetical protein
MPKTRVPERKQKESKPKETDEEFVERMKREHGRPTGADAWRLKKIEQRGRIAILKAYKPKDPHAH